MRVLTMWPDGQEDNWQPGLHQKQYEQQGKRGRGSSVFSTGETAP